MAKHSSWLSKLTISLVTFSALSFAIDEGQMAPPDVKIQDRFGVDLSTGLVTQGLQTVSIGGELGLTHTIRLMANEFKTTGGHGFMDGHSGRAKYEAIAQSDNDIETDNNGNIRIRINDGLGAWTYAMRVFGPAGSHEFLVYKNNNAVKNAAEVTNSYEYRPIGDSRHTLEQKVENNIAYLVWTTPNGTETWYERRGGTAANNGGNLLFTRYPNGLKVNVNYGAATTNTGYALKYQYDGAWGTDPGAILAINLAYEDGCQLSTTHICTQNGWPSAEFSWPVGAPEAFFTPFQEQLQVFSVTDQNGGITNYYYQTQNLCLTNTNDPSSEADTCYLRESSEKWTSRMVAIKTANSNDIDIRYEYQNQGSTHSYFAEISFWQLDNKVGKIKKAWKINDHTMYSEPTFNPSQYGEAGTRGGGGIEATVFSVYPGVLKQVNSIEQGRFIYEENARNFITSHQPVSGPETSYRYDSRGNLYSIQQNQVAIQSAEYPAQCDNPKTCNKPLWTKDAKGNQTDYTYHENSGQIQTITRPAVTINGASVRPKTTYVYEELFATYYHYNGGSYSLKKATDGLWLPKKEWYCRTSNATGSADNTPGCAGGEQDLVVKDYYYGPQLASAPNNLLLRGESVTAYNHAGNQETRVTCYEYDKYGNQIGLTLPKGNAATTVQQCP